MIEERRFGNEPDYNGISSHTESRGSREREDIVFGCGGQTDARTPAFGMSRRRHEHHLSG